MVQMTRFELGQKCLTILQFKVRRNGMEIRYKVLDEKVTKISKLTGATREEVAAFFKKFILPEILAGCELGEKSTTPKPTESEAQIAYRVLKSEYFWDLRELRTEVRQIADKTPLALNDVRAIAILIAAKHVRDQLGDDDSVKLEITDKSE